MKDKQLIYRGLKLLLASGKVSDKGHPGYAVINHGRRPETEPMFKLLSRLSKELKKSGIEDLHYTWWYDFSEWSDYCKFMMYDTPEV